MTKGYWVPAAALALAMAMPATAHAEGKQFALDKVAYYVEGAYKGMKNPNRGWMDHHETARNCVQGIVDAKAAGAVAGDLVGAPSTDFPGVKKKGENYYITFAQAQKVCHDLTVTMAPGMLKSRLGNVFEKLANAEKAEPSEHAASFGRGGKKSCEDSLAEVAALGVTDADAFTYFERKTSLGEIRSLCGQFETFGNQAQARWDVQEKARVEAALAPYKKAGVAGDKLAFIQDEMDTRLYSKGGKVIETPQQFAKAAVVCYVVETSEGLYLVHRYRYKGNKLKSSDDRSYLTHDKALDNCR